MKNITTVVYFYEIGDDKSGVLTDQNNNIITKMTFTGSMVNERCHRSTRSNSPLAVIFFLLFLSETVAFSFLKNSNPSRKTSVSNVNRRDMLISIPSSIVMIGSQKVLAEDDVSVELIPVQVAPPSDVRSLFNEARVYESQVRK